MPYKNQSDSYRNIGGVRYQQWSDVEEDFPELIAEILKEGKRYRVVTMKDKHGTEKRLFKEAPVTKEDAEKETYFGQPLRRKK